MAIYLSNSTVAADAAFGTIVGTLSENKGSATFSLLWSSGAFGIVGGDLVTAWRRPVRPGVYSVFVLARLHSLFPFDLASFPIWVLPAAKGETGSFNPEHAIITTKL